jgi:hypothetical protein
MMTMMLMMMDVFSLFSAMNSSSRYIIIQRVNLDLDERISFCARLQVLERSSC